LLTDLSSTKTQSTEGEHFKNLDDYKKTRLKSKLIDSFYNWLKIKLPDDIFANMTQNYPELIKLVFQELEGEDENMENATNCVIELILLAKRKKEFSSIRDAVISKVEHL
jgi:hypothetical protein